MPTPAIQVRALSKHFVSRDKGKTRIQALSDVNLDIPANEVVGILGPNGAGKTTFLNILATLLLPDNGTVNILGLPLVPRNFSVLRSVINMSSGYPNFLWSLTVSENLRFYGRLYGLRGRRLTHKVEELVEMFDLGAYSRRRFDELSSGTKQRLSLAKALLNDPRIIFLDEPTVGLDPDAAFKTRQMISQRLLRKDVTILLTSHNMPEVEELCQRVAFIKEGRLIRWATVPELKARQDKKDLEEVFLELARARNAEGFEAGEISSVFEAEILPETEALARAEIFKNCRFSGWEAVSRWFNRSWAFAVRNFLFAVRNIFAFMELLFWPMVTLFSIGLMGNFLKLPENAQAFILTGALAGGMLQVAQLDVAYSLLYEVWSKSMKHTLLAPVGTSEHFFGSWLVGMLRGSIVFFVLGWAAVYFFEFSFPDVAVTSIFVAGVFGCAVFLGMLVSILILLFGQKAEITAWMFSYLFMLIGGIYYPVDTLPPFFYHLAQGIPLTHFLEYFRGHLGFAVSKAALEKGFVLLAVYFALALGGMRYAFFQARRKGMIVRLSE